MLENEQRCFPEPLVQFRKQLNVSCKPASNPNRHSYHGQQQSYDQRNSLFSQRTQEDWDQFKCAARKRYSGGFYSSLHALPEDMNSNEEYGRNRVNIDTMQQGPDMQESPRTESVVSGATSKRDEITRPSNQAGPPGGIPLQGQVLVDPNTGQHYLVPQTAFYQPLQPMYYPPPQPAYYPYGQPIPHQPGYMVNHGAQMSHAPYAGSQVHPQYHQYAPPNVPMSQPYRHSYNHQYSSNDDVSRRDDDRHLDEIPPASPSFSTSNTQGFHSPSYASSVTSFAQQYRKQQQQQPYVQQANSRSSPNSQPEDPDNSRDNFRRDFTRSSAEYVRTVNPELQRVHSGEFQRAGSREQLRGMDSQSSVGVRTGSERTPLYGGPPQWWGRPQDEPESLTDVEGKRPVRTSPPVPSTVSDSEAARITQAPVRAPPAKPVRFDIDFNQSSTEESPRPKPPTRSVRLDFDLSKTMPEEIELLEKKKAAVRAPGTAFTVNFDNDKEVSLQDAAKKSLGVRRVLERRSIQSGGPSSSSSGRPSTTSTCAAPARQVEPTNKSYLLQKLLQVDNNSEAAVGSHLVDRRDNDCVSEAGTFVVDVSQRSKTNQPGQLMSSRIVEDSDDSTDSDSGSSRTASPVRPPPPRKPDESNAQSDMLKEMAKLRQMANAKPVTPIAPAVPIPSFGAVPKPASQPTLNKRISLGSQPTNRSVLGNRPSQSNSVAPANNFRRGDGGRFSMRGNGAPAPATASGGASPLQANKRPPFRAGGAPARPLTANPSQQREQEMNAWLRRKDYNPMKAAAEAKKKEQQQRGDQYMSNRSISFHVGPAAQVRNQRPEPRDLSRNRSQESLAVDDAEIASQQIVAEYSRGVVKDLNRLSQQSSQASGKQLSGLAKAVDMLSQKCKRSIELIRSQNKGCLSVSVEDLLAAAADPPRADESLNEQLDRLSDAFDAVQRYLEQYSLDGHQSPIPEFNEEAETGSIVSGISEFSLRSHQLTQNRSSTGTDNTLVSDSATSLKNKLFSDRM